MAGMGQSSHPDMVGYHPLGLPLATGIARTLRPMDVCRERCGNYSVGVKGAFVAGPDHLLGFGLINQTIVRGWEPASTRVTVYRCLSTTQHVMCA
jgi:hypothetical protein